MARIRIDCPEHFSFHCRIPIRINDINYGGHVGNDSLLSLVHEARMQFLQHHGYTEMAIGGLGLIMADAGIEFKAELFYGETVNVSVGIGEISRIGIDIYYKLEKQSGEKTITVALAKTGMICYNYHEKKIAAVPEAVKQKLTGS
jgi:acyl-CoA thioester hydrolase